VMARDAIRVGCSSGRRVSSELSLQLRRELVDGTVQSSVQSSVEFSGEVSDGKGCHKCSVKSLWRRVGSAGGPRPWRDSAETVQWNTS
jgi:hypothetical protein